MAGTDNHDSSTQDLTVTGDTADTMISVIGNFASALLLDARGNTAAAAVQFAAPGPGLALTANKFLGDLAGPA